MQIFDVDGQVCLFDLVTWSGKMSPEPSARESQRARTSALSSKKLCASRKQEFMSLDLTPGAGNLLGESYWEIISLSPGESSTLNTGAWPSGARESSLSQILQDDPPQKYYLTPRACLGILLRAKKRGKKLPQELNRALEIQAGLASPDSGTEAETPTAFAANQRDEVRDLHDIAAAICAQPTGDPMRTQRSGSHGERNRSGMSELSPQGGSEGYGACGDEKQQTFIASFSAGAGKSAGSIGYSEEVTPTLKGSASGNCMPSVMCLADQGGQRIDLHENLSGTLRAQEHGHTPLVYENHGIDGRYTGPHEAAPTMSARYGTGGNNVPLVEHDHAIFSRQRVDVFRDDAVTCTQSARQSKDATDLIVKKHGRGVFLIRRLTPLECERLQGFPDGWTDIPGASDSARYKALGNSVAIPCVEFVLYGVSVALQG